MSDFILLLKFIHVYCLSTVRLRSLLFNMGQVKTFYGQVPNGTFICPWASINFCYFHTPGQPFLNQRKEENDNRKYFISNLHKSMRTGWDQIHDPQISNMTHYRLRYRACQLPMDFLHVCQGLKFPKFQSAEL